MDARLVCARGTWCIFKGNVAPNQKVFPIIETCGDTINVLNKSTTMSVYNLVLRTGRAVTYCTKSRNNCSYANVCKIIVFHVPRGAIWSFKPDGPLHIAPNYELYVINVNVDKIR